LAQTYTTFRDHDSAGTGIRLEQWGDVAITDSLPVGTGSVRIWELPRGRHAACRSCSVAGQVAAPAAPTPAPPATAPPTDQAASPTDVTAERIDGYAGAIDIRLENLPPGLSAPATTIPAEENSTSFALSAEPTARVPDKQPPLKLVARAKIDGKEIKREVAGS